MHDDLPANGELIRTALAEHEQRLTRYARGMLGDADRARDVVQDTFLQLCRQARRSPAAFRGRSALAVWLYTVCRHRVVDVLRREGRVMPLNTVADDPPVSPGVDHASAAAASEVRARLLDELDRLPDKQRDVLRLKFQAGLSYRQIAEVTGLKEGYVGYLIHMGIKTLRTRLEAVV